MKLLVKKNLTLAFLVILLSPLGLAGQNLHPLSISLEDYAYPYAVNFLDLKLEGQEVKMAYMDVKPEGKPNGQRGQRQPNRHGRSLKKQWPPLDQQPIHASPSLRTKKSEKENTWH